MISCTQPKVAAFSRTPYPLRLREKMMDPPLSQILKSKSNELLSSAFSHDRIANSYFDSRSTMIEPSTSSVFKSSFDLLSLFPPEYDDGSPFAHSSLSDELEESDDFWPIPLLLPSRDQILSKYSRKQSLAAKLVSYFNAF